MGLPFALVAPLDRALEVTPNGYYGADRSNRGGIHMGLDFAASRGERVLSMTGGTARVGYDAPVNWQNGKNIGGNGGGNFVAVKVDGHPDYEIKYMHLDAVLVSNGSRVEAGQAIGTAGSTGALNSGVHLHMQADQTVGGAKRHPDFTDEIAALGGKVRRAAGAIGDAGGWWILLGGAALAGAMWWKWRR